jgi:hypothetical protein
MPKDNVEVSLHSKGLLSIRNQRFDRDGDDLGGTLFLGLECAEWLARSIRGFLVDRKPRRKQIGSDAYRSDKTDYVNSPDLGESHLSRDWAEIGSRLALWSA